MYMRYAAPAIEIRGLTKSYGDHLVLDGVSFAVPPGSIVGFIGANGSGKTTTVRCLLGLAKPDSGQALIGGAAYQDLDNPSRIVGALCENAGLQPSMTGMQHLRVALTALGRTEDLDAAAIRLLALVGLEGTERLKVRKMSLGMRQRLERLSLAVPGNQVAVADILGGISMGLSIPAVAVTLFAAVAITGDYRSGGVARAALHQPRRGRLYLEKSGAVAMIVAVATLALVILHGLVLLGGLATQRQSLTVAPLALITMWAKGACALQCYAAFGLGIGFLIRAQVPAALGVIGWAAIESIVRPLSNLLLGGTNVTSVLPFGLASDAVRATVSAQFLPQAPALPSPLALALMAAWAMVLAGLGLLSFRRQELDFGVH